MQARGEYLYAACGTGGLRVFDIAFVDDKGFAKKICDMPGKGPTWVETLVALPDKDGRERLFAEFVKVEAPPVDGAVAPGDPEP